MRKIGGVLNLQQKIGNLQKQNIEYDRVLKYYRSSLNEIPPQAKHGLEKYASFKWQSGLFDMELTFLAEWQLIRAEQNIPKRIAISKLSHNVQWLEKQLNQLNTDLFETKLFISEVRGKIRSKEKLDRLLEEKKRELDGLIERKNKILHKDQGCDIDRIIQKIDKLSELRS